ncbi:MAG: hypothetical protein GY884_00760 [Proteobacteria bacterium]|nr:hypothetical protein [Pseudomonadota bacterium]
MGSELLFLLACTRSAPVPTPSEPAESAAHIPVATGHATTVASEGLEADLAKAQAFYASRPEYEQPLGTGLTPVPGLPDLSADTCGACHTEIYDEWKVSTHAAAWTDPQLQAEMQKSENRWLCRNCHTPLLVAHEQWAVGLEDDDVERPLLVDNPSFDASLRDEGITCAACHVREGTIVGPGLATPDAPSAAPHAVQADPDFTSEKVCTRCHQATATYPGKSFVCTFNTGEEWKAGPYDEEGTNCISCHMPPEDRPAANGGLERTVARHWWRGAGIAKHAGVHPPDEANPPGLELEAEWADVGGVPKLTLTATNANAGHMLPTGDPERWVQLDVVFLDAGGETVGTWDFRIGQTWEWHPLPKKLDDNRLAPRATRTFQIDVPVTAASAKVTASSHRMSPETVAYHDLGDYPISVVTHGLFVTPR